MSPRNVGAWRQARAASSRQFRRRADRRAADLILRHQKIGEAHRESLLAADAAARIKDQRRLARPDDRGQRHRQSKSGMKTEPGEVGAKARFGTGHAQVARHR